MLKSNLKYLRQKKRISQDHLAELLEISRSTYSNYENGKHDFPITILAKVAAYFQVNLDDLWSKDLRINLFNQKKEFSDSILEPEFRVLPVTVSAGQETNIELVKAKAVAGYVEEMRDTDFIADLPKLQIPFLPHGTYRAFEIQGVSMPPIQDGYIVIGKYVEQAKDLKNGKRYILALRKEGVVFKKVVSELEKEKKLILASDNPEFLPYSVHAKDVLEAWEFTAFIGFPNKVDINYMLMDKLHQIEQQIALLTNK